MTIKELLKEIEEFDLKNAKEPKDIRIILGKDVYGGPKARTIEPFCKATKIDFYKKFGQVAFIIDDLAFQPSELYVLGVLLRSLDKAVTFLEGLKTIDEGYEKFINYLYYTKHIVLINREGNASKFEVFKHRNVTDVLIVGSKTSKRALKNLKENKNIKMSKCVHCSPKNQGKDDNDEYYTTWFKYDDKYLEKVDDLKQTSLNSFFIL